MNKYQRAARRARDQMSAGNGRALAPSEACSIMMNAAIAVLDEMGIAEAKALESTEKDTSQEVARKLHERYGAQLLQAEQAREDLCRKIQAERAGSRILRDEKRALEKVLRQLDVSERAIFSKLQIERETCRVLRNENRDLMEDIEEKTWAAAQLLDDNVTFISVLVWVLAVFGLYFIVDHVAKLWL